MPFGFDVFAPPPCPSPQVEERPSDIQLIVEGPEQIKAVGVEPRGSLVVAKSGGRSSQVGRRARDTLSVIKLSEQRQAFLEVLGGASVVAAGECDVPQVFEHLGDAPCLADTSKPGQARLQERPSLIELA